MAFASLDSGDDNLPLAEINMVPLIDVMLVLLIIFMVTAPLLTHAVKIDLPRAASTPNVVKAAHVQLTIDAAGRVFWNGEPLQPAHLSERLAAAGAQATPPELHIRAERTTPYEQIAQVMSQAARHRVFTIGFVTDPTAVR
jgi:biopolymer transport protein ExbD